MTNIIILVLLIFFAALAIANIIKRMKYGSSCCGSQETLPEKNKVRDKNKSHYDFTYLLTVDGMHCVNCVRRVENALNGKEGVWATVNLQDKSVLVYSKTQQSKEEFTRTINDTGYTLINVEDKSGK